MNLFLTIGINYLGHVIKLGHLEVSADNIYAVHCQHTPSKIKYLRLSLACAIFSGVLYLISHKSQLPSTARTNHTTTRSYLKRGSISCIRYRRSVLHHQCLPIHDRSALVEWTLTLAADKLYACSSRTYPMDMISSLGTDQNY